MEANRERRKTVEALERRRRKKIRKLILLLRPLPLKLRRQLLMRLLLMRLLRLKKTLLSGAERSQLEWWRKLTRL